MEQREIREVKVGKEKESKKAPPPAPATLKGKISKAIYEAFPSLPKLKRKKGEKEKER